MWWFVSRSSGDLFDALRKHGEVDAGNVAGKCFFFGEHEGEIRRSRKKQLNTSDIYIYKYIYIYGGFLKWWYPQIIHFNRIFHYRPSILGYPYFWKHPCIYLYVYVFIHTLEHWKSKDHWFSKGFIINNSRGCFFSWSK